LVGLNKTATRSIFVLFKRSGYPALHYEGGRLAEDIHAAKLSGEKPLAQYEDIVFFGDMESIAKESPPIEAYRDYELLDQQYPDAKFILNYRDVNGWIMSRLNHRKGKYYRQYIRHYGTADIAEICTRWRDKWYEHNAAVRSYFADKPGKLLEFELGVDSGEKIAEFVAPEIELNLKYWGNETKRIAKAKANRKRNA
jgi:hypothetical protein